MFYGEILFACESHISQIHKVMFTCLSLGLRVNDIPIYQ